MSDATFRAWLDTCPIPGKATIFCGEKFECLGDCPHEIAPHPDLLPAASWTQEIANCKSMFPNAVSWRSHSLAFSQSTAVELHRMGYKNISVSERFGAKNVEPVFNPWGLLAFDIYYMDNTDFCDFNNAKPAGWRAFDPTLIQHAVSESSKANDKTAFVFDFHPIHLALNTASYATYAKERDPFKQRGERDPEADSRYGVRTFYLHLIEAMAKANLQSLSLIDASKRFRV